MVLGALEIPKEDIPMLAVKLQVPDPFKTKRGDSCGAVEALCMLLCKLSRPRALLDLQHIFFSSKARISAIVSELCSQFYARTFREHRHLNTNWLSPTKLATLAAYAQSKVPLSTVFGFVDATVQQICRPTIDQRQCYNGKDRVHAIKFQSVVTTDGLMVQINGPWSGKMHDGAILSRSLLLEQLARLPYPDSVLPHEPRLQRYQLYADLGYPYSHLIITPFRDHRDNQEHREWNVQMSRSRCAVEWGFQNVTNTFKCLSYHVERQFLRSFIEEQYIVGAFLCNVRCCLYGNQTTEWFAAEKPDLDHYLHSFYNTFRE